MGGCNCNYLAKNKEADNEMLNWSLPESYKKGKKNDDIYEIKNINTDYNNNEKIDNNLDKLQINNKNGLSRNKQKLLEYNSSVLSMIQDLCDSIFDYLNDIRTNPEDFEETAEQYDVGDIIQRIINASSQCKNLTSNSAFNTLLSEYINDNVDDEEDHKKLIEALDKEEKIQNYSKDLLVFEGEINNQKEAIWTLIENNKDIAYETFFTNDIEFIVISCDVKDEYKKFKCYLLILSKKID